MASFSNSFNNSVFVQDAKYKQPGSLEPAEMVGGDEAEDREKSPLR